MKIGQAVSEEHGQNVTNIVTRDLYVRLDHELVFYRFQYISNKSFNQS